MQHRLTTQLLLLPLLTCTYHCQVGCSNTIPIPLYPLLLLPYPNTSNLLPTSLLLFLSCKFQLGLQLAYLPFLEQSTVQFQSVELFLKLRSYCGNSLEIPGKSREISGMTRARKRAGFTRFQTRLHLVTVSQLFYRLLSYCQDVIVLKQVPHSTVY